MSRFLAAMLQMRTGRDVARNIDDLLGLAKDATAQGARFLQSPEMSNILERDRARLFEAVRPEEEDPMLAAARDFARRYSVSFHLGSIAVKSGDRLANRGFLIDAEGEITARYGKMHLFDVDLPNGESWRESATYQAGDCAVLAPAAGAVLGMGICYDLRFPALFHALAKEGADILTAPACFTRQTGEAHWQVLQRARAIETGSYMISAAQGGRHEDGRESYGHSIIVDPWGRVLAEGGDQPGVFLAEIDLDRVSDARSRIPALRHARAITVSRQGFLADQAAE
ncbi:MAG: carbon-nitrogen hydrolase family protein [Beijerinckiaceae bacterium]|jgi:predicted amidohydrolase|nr:carbon-nitrogen hydrolase family protein [Beijerinckiaceae bacterium]